MVAENLGRANYDIGKTQSLDTEHKGITGTVLLTGASYGFVNGWDAYSLSLNAFTAFESLPVLPCSIHLSLQESDGASRGKQPVEGGAGPGEWAGAADILPLRLHDATRGLSRSQLGRCQGALWSRRRGRR